MAQNHQYNPSFVSRQASDITIINRFPPVYSNPQGLNLGLQNSNFVTIPNQQLAAMTPRAKVQPGSQIQSFRPWRPTYCPAAATNQLIGSQVGSTLATASKPIHTGLSTGEPTSRNAGTIAGNITGPIHSVNRRVIASDGDVAKLQSTVARQRSLIAKLIAALVQDRLKQSPGGLGLEDGENLCSEADQLLTYAPRPSNAVPRSFASENTPLESRAIYSSDQQRHRLLPISKKKRRRKHTDEKKKHRKRICRDRKFTSSPKEILSSDGCSPKSCCSRRSKSSSKHRRYRCQHEDRVSTDCDDDFERLRQRALELMDPRGDSRLFSLRSAVSSELTSLAIAIKRAKSNIKSPPKNDAAFPRRPKDGDWAPPSASASDASTLRMSSVTSSASTQVLSSEGRRMKRNYRRRVMRRRKVYSRRLRRSHNRSKPSVKRKASHEAKKKIDSIQQESSEDPEDCAIRAIQQSRALWVDMTKNNAAFHNSRRMIKCRSTLTTVERKLDSCESCTASDDPEVQRINTEALKRFNQLLKSERPPEGKKIDNMYLISRYLSASMPPNSNAGQNQRVVASASGDCQAKISNKKDEKHETNPKPENDFTRTEIHKEAVTTKLNGSSSDIFEESIVAPPDVIGEVVIVGEGQHNLVADDPTSDRQPFSSTPDQDKSATKLSKSTTTDIVVTEVRSLRDCFEPLTPPRGSHDVTSEVNESSRLNCEEPGPSPPQLVEKFRALNERVSPTIGNDSCSPQTSVQDDSFGEGRLYIAEESYVEAKSEPISPEPLPQTEPNHFPGDRTSVVKAVPCYDSDPLPKVAHETKAWPSRKLDDSGDYFPGKHLKPVLSSGASSPCSFGAFSIDDPVELSLVPRRASCKAKERIQEQLCLESSRGRIAATHNFTVHRHTHSCSPVAVRTRNSLKPPTKDSGQREVKLSSSDDEELPPLPWKITRP